MTKPTVATLSTDIAYIKKAISDLDRKLDHNFMPKSEVELRLAEVTRDLADLKIKIVEVEKEAKKRDWRTHTLTSVLTAIGVLAITYIFNDITRGK